MALLWMVVQDKMVEGSGRVHPLSPDTFTAMHSPKNGSFKDQTPYSDAVHCLLCIYATSLFSQARSLLLLLHRPPFCIYLSISGRTDDCNNRHDWNIKK